MNSLLAVGYLLALIAALMILVMVVLFVFG